MSSFTRFEKSGPIFTRITGLIRSGVMKWEDRPLWYDAFVQFPPFESPITSSRNNLIKSAVKEETPLKEL